MNAVNQVLLVLHFVGLVMGLSTSIGNAVMGSLIAAAAPGERPVLGRFPPLMSRIGKIGLTVLWITGVALTETRWGGFANMPWQFHVKLTAVVLLTTTVAFIHTQERAMRRGDAGAGPRIQNASKVAGTLAVIALVFAVLTFD